MTLPVIYWCPSSPQYHPGWFECYHAHLIYPLPYGGALWRLNFVFMVVVRRYEGFLIVGWTIHQLIRLCFLRRHYLFDFGCCFVFFLLCFLDVVGKSIVAGLVGFGWRLGCVVIVGLCQNSNWITAWWSDNFHIFVGCFVCLWIRAVIYSWTSRVSPPVSVEFCLLMFVRVHFLVYKNPERRYSHSTWSRIRFACHVWFLRCCAFCHSVHKMPHFVQELQRPNFSTCVCFSRIVGFTFSRCPTSLAVIHFAFPAFQAEPLLGPHDFHYIFSC